MVNQMIPRTISTPKNFLDQACLNVLIKILYFEWITFVESQINEGPSELTLVMTFLQKVYTESYRIGELAKRIENATYG